MKHTGQGAFAALLALTLVSPLSAQAQEVPEQKSGFFRQLGKGLADTGKQMVGIAERRQQGRQSGDGLDLHAHQWRREAAQPLQGR